MPMLQHIASYATVSLSGQLHDTCRSGTVYVVPDQQQQMCTHDQYMLMQALRFLFLL